MYWRRANNRLCACCWIWNMLNWISKWFWTPFKQKRKNFFWPNGNF